MIKTKILIGLCFGLLLSAPVYADKIRVATEGAYPPFNMKNAKGELVGFDVDITRALCAEMKADCEIVAQDWDGIIPGLLAKKYDAIIASMSITPERKRKVAFTDKYYSNYLRFIAKKGNSLTISKSGLKGKTLGAQRATISAQHLEDNFRRSSNIKVYDTQEAAFLDLKAGRLDALLVDAYPGHDWLSKSENSEYDFAGDQIDINDQIGIAVRKGDKKLVQQFNQAIKALLANGEYDRINKQYFPFSIY